MDSLIIVLDSNVKDPRDVATNTCSDFINILDPPLDMGEDEYEVGVKEIQYPATWFNITEPQYGCILYRTTRAETASDPYSESGEPFLIMTPGRYTDIQDVIDRVNKATSKKFEKVHQNNGKCPKMARVDNEGCDNPIFEKLRRHHVVMVCGISGEYNVQVILTLQLARILGFTDYFFDTCGLHQPIRENTCEMGKKLEILHGREFVPVQMRSETRAAFSNTLIFITKWGWREGSGRIRALEYYHVTTSPCDINAGLDKLVITSDVVKHHRVGNQSRQVLQIVPIGNLSYGEEGYERFDQPYYYPVSHQVIEKIQVQIRDRGGVVH